MAADSCTHLDAIRDVAPTTPDGCEECLATGDRWAHLRICQSCGHIGCCNSSRDKHATEHHDATGRPLVLVLPRRALHGAGGPTPLTSPGPISCSTNAVVAATSAGGHDRNTARRRLPGVVLADRRFASTSAGE